MNDLKAADRLLIEKLKRYNEDSVPMGPAYIYRAIVRSVYDGDTIRVDIDLGMKTWIINEPLRLAWINAPEIRGETREAGIRSKDWLISKIPPGAHIVVETYKDRKGKYGRYLADIFTMQGVYINDLMVAEGMAVPYGG